MLCGKVICTTATVEDIFVLCELLDILFTQEVEFVVNKEAQHRGLSSLIRNTELGHVLVAKINDVIVAMVCLLYTVSTALGDKVAMLEDLVVIPDQRGNGVGSCLLTYSIDFARKQGCKRITLLTDEENVYAQRFYEKHAFVLSTMRPMRLMLIHDN